MAMRIEPEGRALVMGVLNVTPDSFSDGGRFQHLDTALQQAMKMVREGADIIDVGGESTRPFSDAASLEEELGRVIPVIERLVQETDIPVSVDTYKAEVATAAIDAGASIVNDISALRFDSGMARVVAERGVPVILMHMQGQPRNMQVHPHYDDVVEDIRTFFLERMEFAGRNGIPEERIVLDPGIGFGKKVNHNLEIIRRMGEFLPLGRPLLLGSSRKMFIGKVLDRGVDDRVIGTNATVAIGVFNGARIVRVHDVASAKETVLMVEAIKAGFHGTC